MTNSTKVKPAKYIIAGQAFPSKDAGFKAVSKILNSYKWGEYLNKPDRNFIYAFLQTHVEADIKIGCGVATFQVLEGLYGYSRFDIVRVDGSREDFSIKYCLNTKKMSQSQKLCKSFRVAISDQIISFKTEAFARGGRSELSGNTLEWQSSHVDHASPVTFDQLVFNFVKLTGLNIESLSFSGAMLPVLEDEQLVKVWQDYHRDNAVLRLVSMQENLRQPKNQPK